MAEATLPQDRVNAGAEYLVAIRKLGIEPEGLVWIWDEVRSDWALILITGLYDVAPPYDLVKLLFRAYNAPVLPRTIDPFNVDVYSPDQDFARDLFGGNAGKPLDIKMLLKAHPPNNLPLKKINIKLGTLTIPANRIYVWDPGRKSKPSECTRNWHRFKAKVEALPIAA